MGVKFFNEPTHPALFVKMSLLRLLYSQVPPQVFIPTIATCHGDTPTWTTFYQRLERAKAEKQWPRAHMDSVFA